ncbi:class I SAM-dependent methyltransferase [Campylobacter curvus]|uniref:class I SAM-dependent methyltransferase n=1 Tax=Campylobacter curvus TaxID=200 RepID=UPI00147018DE|nr:methyltransferase domain-containing protein [Campylobacter curvus]
MDIEKYLDKKVINKKVLEIGGIGNYEKYVLDNFEGWRHKRLKGIAKSLRGGDINVKGIEVVNQNGFSYFYFDAEKTDMIADIGKFDTILLIDVIEHLNNIGLALENIKKYMSSDSEFIISTPNITSFNNIVRVLLGKKVNTLEDHTVWMDENNFHQFAKRYGFKIIEIHYCTFNPKSGLRQSIINFMGNINKYFHQNFIVVLKILE